MQSQFLTVRGGNQAGQHKDLAKHFTDFIHQFDLIIEIGTSYGWFTVWLNDNIREDTKLVSYEIYGNLVQSKDMCDKATFVTGDVFEQSIINEIHELIKTHDKCLILCDNGFKEIEFNMYSELIKKNDIIMLHDFADTDDKFWEYANAIGWTSGPESRLVNIESAIINNNLEKHPKYDDFVSVFWGGFVKK